MYQYNSPHITTKQPECKCIIDWRLGVDEWSSLGRGVTIVSIGIIIPENNDKKINLFIALFLTPKSKKKVFHANMIVNAKKNLNKVK